MTSPAGSFEEAVSAFDATEYQAFVHQAEEQRNQTLERYPREHWPEMALTEYAQGRRIIRTTSVAGWSARQWRWAASAVARPGS